jgi:hypothetical protein
MKRLAEGFKAMNSVIRKQNTETFKVLEEHAKHASEHVKEQFEKMREAGERAA